MPIACFVLFGWHFKYERYLCGFFRKPFKAFSKSKQIIKTHHLGEHSTTTIYSMLCIKSNLGFYKRYVLHFMAFYSLRRTKEELSGEMQQMGKADRVQQMTFSTGKWTASMRIMPRFSYHPLSSGVSVGRPLNEKKEDVVCHLSKSYSGSDGFHLYT